MGYEIHITRKDRLADDDFNDITIEEWKNFISTQPDMRLDHFAETPIGNGRVLRIENEGTAVWTSYPGNGKDDNHAWFNYGYGEISIKNPDDDLLKKACEIALQLNAVVRGDDGELYQEGRIKN